MGRQENEFKRDKPRKKNGLAFSVFHKVFPLVLAVAFVWFTSQRVAVRFEHDPSIIGPPWFVTDDGRPIYHIFLLPLLIIRHVFSQDPRIANIVLTSAVEMTAGIFLSVLIYFVLSWTRSVFNRKDDNLYGTARWGTKKDLAKNGLLEDRGVVLGQLDSAKVDYAIANGAVKLKVKKTAPLVQHSGKTSTIMFAPSRSGKGVSSVIPTLLSYPGSLITIDPKGENFNITAGFRRKFSHILRFSPVSRDTLHFNILDEIEEESAFRDASVIADILVTPSDGKIEGNSKHWIETARDLLTGAILHVKCSNYPDKTLHGVLSFLSSATKGGGEEDDKGASLMNLMITSKHCTDEIHASIVNVARRNLARPDTERGSVFSTAVTALQIFEDPMVANATSSSDFSLKDFRVSDLPISWYITVPFADLDRLSSLLRLLISFVLRKFSSGETQFGEEKLKHPILFLIDEFPTLGAFPVLETMMGILAGYGITFYLICQSLTQILKLYGENNPILDHCRIMATYAMADSRSAEMFSKLIGVESVTNNNISNSGSRYDFGMNNLNVSEQTVQRNLMNADEVQHLPANQMLVFAHGMPAVICKKTAYYDDPRFKDKINLPKPESREELLLECSSSVCLLPSDDVWCDPPVEIDCYVPNGDFVSANEMKQQMPSDEQLKELSSIQRGAII